MTLEIERPVKTLRFDAACIAVRCAMANRHTLWPHQIAMERMLPLGQRPLDRSCVDHCTGPDNELVRCDAESVQPAPEGYGGSAHRGALGG